MDRKTKGKLIVIDGIDCSGKATQTGIMKDCLEESGFGVKTVSFPQYGEKSAGPAENYLSGRYGGLDDISPYQAAVLYAVDRFDARSAIRGWLEKGQIVIVNRYVSANLAYQGSRLNTALHRRTFYEWARDLEYKIMGAAMPDAVYYLQVEADIAAELMRRRRRPEWPGKKGDIRDRQTDYLRAAEHAYEEISRIYPEVKAIPCTEAREMLSTEEISRRLWAELARLLGIKTLLPDAGCRFRAGRFAYPPEKRAGLRFKALNGLFTEPVLEHGKRSYLLFAADYHTLRPGESELITAGLSVEMPPEKFAWVIDAAGRPQQMLSPGISNEIFIEIANRGHDDLHISPRQIIGYLHIFKNE